jgi:hypothetical protein
MATKYIVDNLSGQTINGDITINGNITVTGTSNNSGTYRALLTQTGPITGTNLSEFDYGLIVGETYTITNYVSNDDFSNVADVQSGGPLLDFDYDWSPVVGINGNFNGLTGTTSGSGSGASFDVNWCGTTTPIIINIVIDTDGDGYVVGDTITILGTELSGSTPANDLTITVTEVDTNVNVTGSVFIATGQTPNYWEDGSELVSNGGLIVDVLENTLGYGLSWLQAPFGGDGYYIAVNSNTGPIYNSFQRDKVAVITPLKYPFNYGSPTLVVPYISTVNNKDDSIGIDVYDSFVTQSNDLLYYTPIEIKINQDTDITPIVISGTTTSFPFTNVSVEFYCGDMFIQYFYTSGSTIVNDISEVVTVLNTDTNTSFLGTFSDDGGNIILTMSANLETQFCANSTLTFNVFND